MCSNKANEVIDSSGLSTSRCNRNSAAAPNTASDPSGIPTKSARKTTKQIGIYRNMEGPIRKLLICCPAIERICKPSIVNRLLTVASLIAPFELSGVKTVTAVTSRPKVQRIDDRKIWILRQKPIDLVSILGWKNRTRRIGQ